MDLYEFGHWAWEAGQEEFAELITSPKILKKEGALFIQYRNDMLSDEHMRSLYIKRLEPRKVIFQRVKIKVAEGEKIIDIVDATNIIALPVN